MGKRGIMSILMFPYNILKTVEKLNNILFFFLTANHNLQSIEFSNFEQQIRVIERSRSFFKIQNCRETFPVLGMQTIGFVFEEE